MQALAIARQLQGKQVHTLCLFLIFCLLLHSYHTVVHLFTDGIYGIPVFTSIKRCHAEEKTLTL